jgi:hypothetical protein
MGAVLGLAAFGRTQEKIAGANNGGLSTQTGFGTTYQSAQPTSQPFPGNTSTPASTGFGAAAPSTGFGSNFSTAVDTTSSAATVLTGFGGKPAPIQPSFPII